MELPYNKRSSVTRVYNIIICLNDQMINLILDKHNFHNSWWIILHSYSLYFITLTFHNLSYF